MAERKRSRNDDGNDDESNSRVMPYNNYNSSNAMNVDRRHVIARSEPARRETQFMQDVTSKRQQLVERENSAMGHHIATITSGPDGIAANRIMQSTAEHRRVYRAIDTHYPDRSLFADVASMGNDDMYSLGVRLSDDDEIRFEYPPNIVRNIPPKAMVSVAAGGTHSVVLHYDGTVYTFGSNDDGQLGRYDTSSDGAEYKAGKVVQGDGKPLGRITEIHAGDSHTLMKDIDGNVYMVGMYKDTDSGKWRPPMDEGPIRDIKDIKGWHKHACKIKLPRPAKFVATGLNFSAAVLPADNNVPASDVIYTWGMGHSGALGRSRTMGCPENTTTIPTAAGPITYDGFETLKPFMGQTITTVVTEPVEKPDGTTEQVQKEDTTFEYLADRLKQFLIPAQVEWSVKMSRQVLSVAMGELHMVVVARESSHGQLQFQPRVYSCGHSGKGQLGHGDQTEKHQLTPITALDGKMIAKVAAGAGHCLALDMLGQNVYSWGDPVSGVLGLYDEENLAYVTTPQEVAFPENLGDTCIVDIAAGDSASFAITQDNDVYSWGYGEMGATGHPGNNDINRPKKLDVMRRIKRDGQEEKCKVLRVDGGGQHSLVLIQRCK
mmetsp:Transcript_57364/g.139958  ORF Transcript_57364/g.139958 Transcript_57364/m.139958 type:complete len:604 (+) Transcript_57364:332-2143(+)